MQSFNNQTARPMNPNQAGYNMSMQANSAPQAVNNAQYQAYNQNYQQQNTQTSNQPYMQQTAQPQQYSRNYGNRGYRSQQTQSNGQQPQYQRQYNSASNNSYSSNRANQGYQQQNQNQNSNGYRQQNKPVFPYDKFVRRVFNAWEKGTDSCPPWNDGSFEGLKNDLKQQKPFGFIVVDNVAVLKLPFDETVRNYLRNTYSMTFCGRGKFWGVKAEFAVKVMQDLNLATTSGLHLPDGTFYVIPKRAKNNRYSNTSSGYNSGNQQGYNQNSGYQSNQYQQYQ